MTHFDLRVIRNLLYFRNGGVNREQLAARLGIRERTLASSLNRINETIGLNLRMKDNGSYMQGLSPEYAARLEALIKTWPYKSSENKYPKSES